MEVLALEDKLEQATNKRDNNLRKLLELKLSWQQLESGKLANLEKREQLKREYDEKERQHHAAIILQNKIKVMYISKLKNKRLKAAGNKKKQKGKKKKKTASHSR